MFYMRIKTSVHASFTAALAACFLMVGCAPSGSNLESSTPATPASPAASTPSSDAAPSPTTKSSESASTDKAAYPEEVVQNFMDSCMKSGGNQAQCSCSINKIQERYSFDEFKQVEAEIQRTNELPSGMVEILESCRSAT
jgi:hypothetical protein